MLQEEQSVEEGLQRHFAWPVKLPRGQEALCYFVPHCNTIWWATSKDLFTADGIKSLTDACGMRKSSLSLNWKGV
jgi:hypothetical protein